MQYILILLSVLDAIKEYIKSILIIEPIASLVNVLLVLLPVLMSVAFMTIIERKQLAAMQRRYGPNTVCIYGVLQPFVKKVKRAASFSNK